MKYASFFTLFLERKNWANNVLKSGEIAQNIILKIKNGELSVVKGHNKYQIRDLNIVLKAFNNYKKEGYKNTNAFFIPSDPPIIEVFIFEILDDVVGNIRGYDSAKLNNVLLKILKSEKYTTKLISILQHELEHAFEHESGILQYTDTITNSTSEDEEYYNDISEIHARIVEFVSPINNQWNKELKDQVWLNIHTNRDEINDIIQHKLKMNDAFKNTFLWLTNDNKKKFLKSIYTTLQHLWDYYNTQAENERFKSYISDDFIEKYVKSL